jgi:predicted alpha/beta-hydrolase family hydrolase
MLFIQGTRDPFAQRELLAKVLKKLGDKSQHVPIEGGDHSFRVPGKKPSDREIGAGLAEPAAAFIGKVNT